MHSLVRRTSHLDRLIRGKPIVVHGDGSSFWVSCHADDVARASVGSAGNAKVIGRSYHAAGEEWLTWDQHHDAVAAAIETPPPHIVHIPTDFLVRIAPERCGLVADNFQFNNIFDNAAARTEVGFRSTIPLKEGLHRWYQSLTEARMIEDSDADPLEDQIRAAWHRVASLGSIELAQARADA